MAKFGTTQARTANRATVDRLRARLDGISEANINRSVQRTLAGARRRFEPAAKRIIRQHYNIKARALAGQFRVRTGNDAGAEFIALDASIKRVPLIEFGGRWRKRQPVGATAEVRPGARQAYQSTFIAMIRGSRRLVARQLIRGGGGKRDPRNRLRTIMGPSPFQMVEGDNDANARAIAAEVHAFIGTELQRQLQLQRKGAK